MGLIDQSFCYLDGLGKIASLPFPAILHHPGIHDLEREFPHIADCIWIFESVLGAVIKIPCICHELKSLRILPDVMCSCPEGAQARNLPEIFVFLFYQDEVIKGNSMHPYFAAFVD